MKNVMKRIITLLLAVVMVLNLPVMSLEVRAEDTTKTITGLGTGTIGDPPISTNEWAGSFVYFGKYSSSTPVKYRVLQKSTNRFSERNTLFLDCDSVLFTSQFGSNEFWDSADCELRKILNNMYNNNDYFTSAEKNSIVKSVYTYPCPFEVGDGEKVYLGEDVDDYIFILDAYEIFVLPNSYGYRNKNNRKKTGSYSNNYFLRSKRKIGSNYYLGCVNAEGDMDYAEFSQERGVSPALNVDLSKILFSSEVSGEANTYKLTLTDEAITADTISDITANNGTITVPYSLGGTNKGNVNQVSILLLKSPYSAGTAVTNDSTQTSGIPKYKYIKLNTTIDSNTTTTGRGTGTFVLPPEYRSLVCGVDYFAYIVAEDVNGAKESDYASVPKEIYLPHVHDFEYSASGNIITAKCKTASCDKHITGYSFTLEAPAHAMVGDQKNANATFSGSEEFEAATGINLSSIPIKYYKLNDTSELSSAPTDVGTYTAKITVGGATASVNYRILPHSHTFEYTGSGDTITATCNVTGCTLENDHKVVLKIKPPARQRVNDDLNASATLEGLDAFNLATGKFYSAADIRYEDREGNVSSTPPNSVGTFKAYIVIEGAKAEVEYSIAEHVHSWTYSASGDTITATCTKDGCEQHTTNKPTLTIVEPTLKMPGGAGSASATLDGLEDFNTATGLSVQAGSIKYYKNTTELDSAPTEVGSYTAKITVEGKTASINYQIVSHAHTMTYSATGDTITATCSVGGCTLTDSKITLKLKPPAKTMVDDDKSAAAILDNLRNFNRETGAGISVADVEYSTGDNVYDATPIEQAGNCIAKLQVGSTATAYISYTIAPHTHDFTYSASGDTITATCKYNSCDLHTTDRPALKVLPPLHTMENDGKSAAARLEPLNDFYILTHKSSSDVTITYKKAGDSTVLTEAPTVAGTYVAYATLGDKTAEVQYTITPHIHNFVYSLNTDGDTIIANCDLTGCPLTDHKVELKLVKPARTMVNDDQVVEANLEGLDDFNLATGNSLSTASIRYSANGTNYNNTPPNVAGNCTASIIAGGVKAQVTYTLTEHVHHYELSASGDTVTASCTYSSCREHTTGRPALTIVAPTRTMFNGSGNVNATLTGVDKINTVPGVNVSEANIKYVGRDGTELVETATAPSAIGKYTAKIEVGNNVALVHYEITPHKHTFAYSLNDAKDTITATCNVIGCHLPDKKVTLKLVAPTISIEGGEGSPQATFEGLDEFNRETELNLSVSDIKYVGRDGTAYSEQYTVPTTAGKYTAKIRVSNVTAWVNYEIGGHIHNFTYSVDGPTITADCSEVGCGLVQHKVEMTLTAPALKNAGGVESPKATLTGMNDFVSQTKVNVNPNYITYVGISGTRYTESYTPPTKAGNYMAKYTVKGQTLQLKYSILPHTHLFVYEAKGSVLYAECIMDDCALPQGRLALTIKSPEVVSSGDGKSVNATLDGMEKFNSLTGQYLKESDITYVGRDKTVYAESNTAPTAAGKYTAKIQVGDAIASVDYSISSHVHNITYEAQGATITATCKNAECTLEGGRAQFSIVAPTIDGSGNGTANATLTDCTAFNAATGFDANVKGIRYVGINGTVYAESSTAPTKEGTYTAKITVAGKTASVDYAIAAHSHAFAYTSDGTTITASCTVGNCPYGSNKPQITLVAPTMTEEFGSGTEKAVLNGVENFNSVTGQSISDSSVVYVGRNGTDYAASSRAPKTAGYYTASLTIEGAVAQVDYRIMPGVSVMYQSHVQGIGWFQDYASDGAVSGTIGENRRMEAIKIKVEGGDDLGISYTTHVQTYGWMPWVCDDTISGTEGESKRVEALKIRLTGADSDKYDVYYRVHAQGFGWMGWAKNGEAAGSAGYSRRLEAFQIVVVKAGEPIVQDMKGYTSVFPDPYSTLTGESTDVPEPTYASIAYRTHVQTYGWQGFRYNGQAAGTSGESKRLESIIINLSGQDYDGGVCYITHVQTYGWQGDINNQASWKHDGELAGTRGESKRLESICINLYGEMAEHYDIYYRVHAQTYGWLGWSSNGAPAGTAGHSKRLEAIEIVLVSKGGAAPGSTENSFIQ